MITKLKAALIALLLLSWPAICTAAPDPAPTYPRMAPVEAYLMDRAQEITLARSAAPAAISDHATILVLTRAGYETAVTGTNGFVCMVARGFSGAPDWPERWNPKIRAAACDNPQAAHTMTEIAKLRSRLTLAGQSDAQVLTAIAGALRTHAIPPLAPGAMCYMMSKSAYLSEDGEHDMAHLMFYVPRKDGADWGANLEKSPVFGGNYWFLTANTNVEAAALPPLSVLLVPVATWSDGSAASAQKM